MTIKLNYFITLAVAFVVGWQSSPVKADIGSIHAKWLKVENVYQVEREVKAQYQLTNKGNSDLELIIEPSYESAVIPKVVLPLKKISIKRDGNYQGAINLGKMSQLIEPGKIEFNIAVKTVEGDYLASLSHSAEIKTSPVIKADVTLGNKKVYHLGEIVPIKVYLADMKTSVVKTSIVIERDKKKVLLIKKLDYQWTPKAEGNYKIKVALAAPGYKPYNYEKEIVVIGKEIKPMTVSKLRQNQLSKVKKPEIKTAQKTEPAMTFDEQINYLLEGIRLINISSSMNADQLMFLDGPRLYLGRHGFEKAKQRLLN